MFDNSLRSLKQVLRRLWKAAQVTFFWEYVAYLAARVYIQPRITVKQTTSPKASVELFSLLRDTISLIIFLQKMILQKRCLTRTIHNEIVVATLLRLSLSWHVCRQY